MDDDPQRLDIIIRSRSIVPPARTVRVAVLAAAFLSFVNPAISAEPKEARRWISGNVSFELQSDATVDSESPEDERNDLYTTIEPTVTVHFARTFSLNVHAVLEPVREPDPGEDRYFDGHGLYLEELHLDFSTDRFALIGGKFTPNFGKAWDAAPGINGTDIAEDYELTERIGFGGSVTVKPKGLGQHALSASVFFLDTSPLSDATITSRPRNRKSDGGPSNTESLESVAAALDGTLPPPTALTYHLAFVNQAQGKGDAADERGVTFALLRTFEMGGMELTPLFEYAHFWNADAVDEQSRDYLTLALGLGWKGWNMAAVYARRDSNFAGSSNFNDSLFQLSAGYAFPFGITLDLGWRILVEEDITSHTIGTLLTYNLDFAS